MAAGLVPPRARPHWWRSRSLLGTAVVAVAAAVALRVELRALQGRARRELGDTALPLILAGHSLGGELALWQAATGAPPALAGVVAISPGARSHLRVTAMDLANREPSEPGSFAVDSMVRAVAPCVRVAIVRGDGDPLRIVRLRHPSVLGAGRRPEALGQTDTRCHPAGTGSGAGRGVPGGTKVAR